MSGLEPFILAWMGNPKRLKALQTECENKIAEMFTFRRVFNRGDFKEKTQEGFNMMIDIWLTLNGYDNRLKVRDFK